MAFFDRHRVLAAWCELRQDFRHFRADPVRSVTALIERWSRQLCSRTDRC